MLYSGVPGPLSGKTSPDWVQRTVPKAYRATIAYIDVQIGKVLDALDASGMAPDTHIVFLGDHGMDIFYLFRCIQSNK